MKVSQIVSLVGALALGFSMVAQADNNASSSSNTQNNATEMHQKMKDKCAQNPNMDQCKKMEKMNAECAKQPTTDKCKKMQAKAQKKMQQHNNNMQQNNNNQ